jgi:hypothetical protein
MSRAKVIIQESGIRVVTVGIQGPPGVGGATQAYVDAGDAASRARANHIGTQLASTISDFATAADARIGIQKGVANGLATLGSDNKIPNSQLPALAITDTFPVASQAAMLALTAEVGDVAVRTDLNKTFILRIAGATTLANWQELLTPTDAVFSVNGQTGAVSLTASGLGALVATNNLSDITNAATARTNLGAAAAAHTHAESDVVGLAADLAAKAPLASPALTGTPTAPTAAPGTNNTQIATTAYADASAAAGTPDATSSVKGKVQLAGDLGGTATSPTVKATVTQVVVTTSSGYVADQYCNGSNDDVEIQAAINAANGGTVVLRKGSYSISAQLSIPTGTTIRGEGKGNTILVLANGANVTMFRNSDTTSGNTDITIADLTIDGNKSNQSSGTPRGIWFTKLTRALVDNVYLHDVYDRAILYTQCVKSTISRVDGVDCGHFQEQVFTFESCDRCVYSDCFASGGTDRDFEIAFCTNCELHNCMSVAPAGAGLGIYSTSAAVNTGIVVDGFICINPASECIYLERVAKSFFSNIYGFNTGSDGIGSLGSAAFMADNEFNNIHIYGTGADYSGIKVAGPRSTYSNIKIYNAGQHGIRLTDPECRVTNCHIYGAGQNCFWLGTAAHHTGISHCLGKNGGQDAVVTHTYGLKMESDYNQITGNNFFDDQGSPTQTHGIRDLGDYNVMIGNGVVGNATPIQYLNATAVIANNPGFQSCPSRQPQHSSDKSTSAAQLMLDLRSIR